MSQDVPDDEVSPQSLGLLRRRFLKRALLTTATTSAAALVPALTSGAAREDSALPKNCADTKAPMKDVEGKVAFITGAASGVGLGIAKAFVSAGMKVVIADINEKRIQEVLAYFADAKQAGQVHGIKVDVTDRAALAQAAAETVKVFGKVHVLVNNAGVYAKGTLSAATEKDWDWMMDVNVKGVLHGVQVFLPLIQAHGEGGQIMTTSSILGLFVYAPNEVGYAATKFAVMAMMESLHMELKGTKVGVSVLCPGGTRGRSLISARRESMTEKEEAEFDRWMQALIDEGSVMDDRVYGERVLRGMRNNDLYILTHPEWEQMMLRRFEALTAAVPRDSHPTPKLLAGTTKVAQDSIYVAELNRKRCR